MSRKRFSRQAPARYARDPMAVIPALAIGAGRVLVFGVGFGDCVGSGF